MAQIQDTPQLSASTSPTSKRYLNLGCGHRYRANWVNVDFTTTGDGVIAHNLTQGIPFPDASFDLVYHSHVLEHFSKAGAVPFLQECYRVLRPGGILRVVVPDLEQIARMYLKALEEASVGSAAWLHHYEWLLLELFDQTVRNRPGGDMLAYLQRSQIPNPEFVIERCGVEIKNLMAIGATLRATAPEQPASIHPLKLWAARIYSVLFDRAYRRERQLRRLLGEEYQALEIGRFRLGGEVHQWMYDRYSLSQLLQSCGFQNVIRRTATDSYLEDWNRFDLDTEPDGSIYKPDSLFMEAVKPTV
jgi:SAM-dependent methyltransferase